MTKKIKLFFTFLLAAVCCFSLACLVACSGSGTPASKPSELEVGPYLSEENFALDIGESRQLTVGNGKASSWTTSDAQIAAAADLVREKWGDLDILVHSVAFANREDLSGRFLDTSRDGFHLALDISAYSLTGLCRAFEPLLHEGSSVLCMTYHGSTQGHSRLQCHGRCQGRSGSLGALSVL